MSHTICQLVLCKLVKLNKHFVMAEKDDNVERLNQLSRLLFNEEGTINACLERALENTYVHKDSLLSELSPSLAEGA